MSSSSSQRWCGKNFLFWRRSTSKRSLCQDRLGTSIRRVERENGVFWSVKDGNSRLSFGIQWRTILREVGDALGGEDMSGVKTRRVFAVAGQGEACFESDDVASIDFQVAHQPDHGMVIIHFQSPALEQTKPRLQRKLARQNRFLDLHQKATVRVSLGWLLVDLSFRPLLFSSPD